jgi:hypothetical protein
VKVIVYEPAGPVIPRPLNVTTPLIAATVTVPMSDAPAEPAVIDAVTDEPVETVKPSASWNATIGCVVNAMALIPPLAVVNVPILVIDAAPIVMLCVATVNPVAVKVIV